MGSNSSRREMCTFCCVVNMLMQCDVRIEAFATRK